MKRRTLLFLLPVLFGTCAHAQFVADVSSARTADEASAKADVTARQIAINLAGATQAIRSELSRIGRYHPNHPLSFPMTVWLSKGGRIASPMGGGFPPGGGLTLVFDSSGSRAFPPAYQAKLQAIFASAQSTMNNVFGPPSTPGNVFVKDYNADISDRGFFSGGFYIPNASGGPEIHFPEYADDASTAVNFIHVLLLAYFGPDQYGFDAFNEGLVRAATMAVARTPSALPGYDQSAISDVLENSYDVGPWYDWYNQRPLGCSHFVAPNLANQALNGGVGGLYLMRYRMSGSVWQKMLAEHPSFISAFNTAFYANPSIGSNVPALVALAQTTLNAISGGSGTIEGKTFSEWFRRQFILETHDTSGRKLLVQPVPLTASLSAGDFGPYLIAANYFQTLSSGDEILSSATCYPIFWEGDIGLTRLFTNAQDERLDVTSGFGEIAPNLPDLNGGVPYRATIDMPVQSQLGRVYLPVGSVATFTNQTPSDFYGTVTGVFLQSGDSLRLQVSVNGSSVPDVPVTDTGAFGTIVGTQSYLGYGTVTVNVVRHNAGGDTVILTRTIDKGPGSLALDLRVSSDVNYTWPSGIPKGVSTLGFPVDPWASYNPDIVGASTLIARYDPSSGHYELYPDAEPFKIGAGFFLRSDSLQNPFTVSGLAYRNISGSVSLRPGWNLISNPLAETSQLDHVRSVHTADFPQFFTDAEGSVIGSEFFEFQPGQNDAASGAPETGSMVPATAFEEGKAYFVRVLAPEGVTLVFDPAAGIQLAQRASRSKAATMTGRGWLMGVTLMDGNFRIGAQIGQSATATEAFDPREDAELPPAPAAGRQVAVTDIGSMYRDVRRLGVSDTFTLRITGLRTGSHYRLSFDRIRNSPGLFALYRGDGSIVGRFVAGQQIDFTASGPSAVLRLRVNGGLGQ